MLHQFGQTDKATDAHWTAWACVLAPDATTDWATAVALAENSVHSEPKSVLYLNTLGAVLYRAGRFDESLARLSEAGALVQEPSEATLFPPAYIWFFLAMAHGQLGNQEEARQWYDKAVAWTQANKPDDVELRRFQAEAATLLGVTLPAAEPAPAPAAKVEEAQELPKSTPAPEAAKEEEKPQ